MHSLPLFVRMAGRPVILLGEGEAADAKRRLLERAGANVVGEDRPAALAIVAIEDEGEARAAVARLQARGILVNAVDRPDLCDFTLPAIVDRDPLLIAVATGGASAGLAKAIRQRIEALLPAGIGRLAEALGQAKGALRARFPDAADRRAAIDGALAEGGALDPLTEHDVHAVARWLASAEESAETRLVTIRLASPDPDDLTLVAARLLGRADRVYHRANVPLAILDRARADAVRIVCDKPPADPGMGLSLDLSL
ncbi:siroheme synthase [Sphingomonas gilva]|uniref:precorrin-2 dehydrogenase n=1 Tax=Sphingomonas gilva TaxID=2305907 RepID=A0A396RPP2_9SPHN|nr:bifunctional precorrin-2 dehydrogenase/sirohydrochlorin ferrochelatase [Sphingomonas gilva]RHW17796.1 siroheme synthase [Sphingomonas gilva]